MVSTRTFRSLDDAKLTSFNVDNETVMDALEKDKGIEYLDAIVDLKSAIVYVKKHYAKGKVLG